MDDLIPGSAERLVRELTEATRSLEDLSPAELDQVKAWFRLEEARRSLEHRINLARFDVTQESKRFLATFETSKATQRTYSGALERYLAWCQRRQLHPAAVSVVDGDEYLVWLSVQRSQTGSSQGTLLSPATRRSAVAAVHRWYNWLGRRHPWISNPLRNRSKREPIIPTREFSIPTALEVDRILDFLRAKTLLEEAAFVGVLRYCGLRITGAAVMTVNRDGTFRTESKRRRMAGRIPNEAQALLGAAGLREGAVFARRKPESWRQMLHRLLTDLVELGVVPTVYSAHDFRNLFAVEHYRQHLDILALRDRLGHVSVSVTEKYLRALGETL